MLSHARKMLIFVESWFLHVQQLFPPPFGTTYKELKDQEEGLSPQQASLEISI